MWKSILSFTNSFISKSGLSMPIIWILVGIILSMTFGCSYMLRNYSKQISELNTQLFKSEANKTILWADLNKSLEIINIQNDNFRKLQVDLEGLKEAKTKIVTKYKTINVPLKSNIDAANISGQLDLCRTEIKFYESLFERLGNANK